MKFELCSIKIYQFADLRSFSSASIILLIFFRIIIKAKRMSNNAKKVHTRRKFTNEEDDLIRKLVAEHGEYCWHLVAMKIPGRTPRQCRERYNNNLKPDFITSEWTYEEDASLYMKYLEFGPQWTKISQFFQGRSPATIKNRWNYYVSKQTASFFLYSLDQKNNNDHGPNQKLEIVNKEKES